MYKMYTIKKLLPVMLPLLFAGEAFGQKDTAEYHSYKRMSLKELLNVKIESASKQDELLLDAPLSASVVNRVDIERAGCTSLMEALRLVPGMIVREETNGNYDIHLRGMDNVPPNAPFDIASNTTTLVMIDNRPVYSYLRGGTFWETLPVALNDVEKIEVVRGPSAALYGPNAVNGVINIITRRAEHKGPYLEANMLHGSSLTYADNISAGYRFNDKWSVIASGNYDSRDRTQLSYFEFNRNEYLTNPDYFLNITNYTVRNVDQRYPDQPLATKKYAGNIFLNADLSGNTKFSFSAGAQHSEVQKVSSENEVTPLSTATSESGYAAVRGYVHGLSTQFSYNGGTQSTDNDPGRKYDYHIAGANLEYNYTRGALSIKPGLSYTTAVYDDTRYSNLQTKSGLLNARGEIDTRSAFLRGEYRLLANKLRLVAGAATTNFNHPNGTYLSYEFAGTYKLNQRHVFRVVFSQAPRSSNIFDAYATKTIQNYPTAQHQYTRVQLESNPDAKLMHADMVEFGYRAQLARNWNVDVELFHMDGSDYNTPVYGRPYQQLEGADTINMIPVRSTTLPMRLHQYGATISLAWRYERLEVRPFATLQHTEALHFAPYINTPDAGTPNAAENNIYSGMNNHSTLSSTPAFFGGATVNYVVNDWMNVNISSYSYSSQVYYHLSNILFNDGIRGIDHIPAKLIINANVSFMPAKGLRLFCTGKNLLNENYREFFKADAIPFMLAAGMKYDL